MAEVPHPCALQKPVLTDRAITGVIGALCMAWAGCASAQSDRAVGILTGEERAQYEATLAFCRDDVNRDRNRCKRFERAYPGALPPHQPAGAAPETATAGE